MTDQQDLTELYEHRRARLEELLRLYPTKAALARKLGKEPSYVSRLLFKPGDKGRRNIGDELIFAAMRTLGLPPGWFDMPLGSAIPGTQATGTADVVQLHSHARAQPAQTSPADVFNAFAAIMQTLDPETRRAALGHCERLLDEAADVAQLAKLFALTVGARKATGTG